MATVPAAEIDELGSVGHGNEPLPVDVKFPPVFAINTTTALPESKLIDPEEFIVVEAN